MSARAAGNSRTWKQDRSKRDRGLQGSPGVARACCCSSLGHLLPGALGTTLRPTPPVMRGSQDGGLAPNLGGPDPSHPDHPQIQEHSPLPLPARATLYPAQCPTLWTLSEWGLPGATDCGPGGLNCTTSNPRWLLNAGIGRCCLISSSFDFLSSSVFLLNTLA